MDSEPPPPGEDEAPSQLSQPVAAALQPHPYALGNPAAGDYQHHAAAPGFGSYDYSAYLYGSSYAYGHDPNMYSQMQHQCPGHAAEDPAPRTMPAAKTAAGPTSAAEVKAPAASPPPPPTLPEARAGPDSAKDGTLEPPGAVNLQPNEFQRQLMGLADKKSEVGEQKQSRKAMKPLLKGARIFVPLPKEAAAAAAAAAAAKAEAAASKAAKPRAAAVGSLPTTSGNPTPEASKSTLKAFSMDSPPRKKKADEDGKQDALKAADTLKAVDALKAAAQAGRGRGSRSRSRGSRSASPARKGQMLSRHSPGRRGSPYRRASPSAKWSPSARWSRSPPRRNGPPRSPYRSPYRRRSPSVVDDPPTGGQAVGAPPPEALQDGARQAGVLALRLAGGRGLQVKALLLGSVGKPTAPVAAAAVAAAPLPSGGVGGKQAAFPAARHPGEDQPGVLAPAPA
eukprot:gene16556-22785_t